VIGNLKFIMSLTTSLKKIKVAESFDRPANRSTELLQGAAVFNLLEDPGFLDEWNRLYKICKWATVFQSPSFVTTWYRVYGNEFLPMLIKTEYGGKLEGLLTLAIDKNGLITGAGTNQAEYQVWLTANANDESFITNALLVLRRVFPQNRFLLKYIPAGVPLGFTKKDSAWNKRCFVKESPQPLMIINDDHLTRELKKKNRKEKVNRLKRLGALSFEKISDQAAFASVFDELALQSDFRKGALYNKVVFKTDPLRKKFLLSLFEQNNLHITVLKLNDKIIASNVSVSGNGQLHLQGINSFDAAYGRYSPGIIHFLFLGKLLAEEGVNIFDLTPGADAYKDTLATDYSVAYTLSIGNDYHGLINRLKFRLNSFGKKTAAIIGIKRDTIKKGRRRVTLYKAQLMHIARQGFGSLFSLVVNKLKTQSKTSTCWAVQKGFATSGLLKIQKDNLNDLLDFDQRDVSYSKQEFLAAAMKRFEEGGHCYSWAEDGLLLACVWVDNVSASTAEFKYGRETAGIFISFTGLYCHPNSHKQFSLFLRSVANVLSLGNPHDKFYLITDYNDEKSFAAAGFSQLK
jgi:CelD/BcsL family acetyltransferase involved in cellulose biosynthesis